MERLVRLGVDRRGAQVAEFALGRPAMGAGDVTLMAVIGAFLGWQATVIAFLIAPILALVLGPLARRAHRRGRCSVWPVPGP